MKSIKNEIIDIDSEVEIVEEFLNAPTTFLEIEKNRDLIRLEMNIVEYPIFSKSKMIKNNQILKYYFSTDRSSYLEITPKVNSQIPSEFDERVFIALTKIMRDNDFNRTFYTSVSQIIDNMKIENEGTKKGFYKRVKVSIERMANTNFKFKNLYYSNQENGILNDLIDTNMLSYRVITFKDAKEEEENLFSDKRVKEIYFITISDLFHQNIIKKGYLTFDADKLLSIRDPITRAIYTMITKWRNRELYLVKEAFFVARRIPLSWDNPYRTIKRLEKSCKELKILNLVKEFRLLKKGKWDEAIFEFFFTEEHNKINQQNFYEEKKLFGKTIAYVEERSHTNENTTISGVSIDTSEIIGIFPLVAQKLKTLNTVIKEALKKYDYNFVKSTAEYTAFNCKVSYIKYFKNALENNWAAEYIIKKEIREEKKEKKKKVIEEAVLIEDTVNKKLDITWEEFESFEEKIKIKIEAQAYEEYLIEIGSNDNKIIKGIYEKSKKSHILKICNTNEKFKKIEQINPNNHLIVENTKIQENEENNVRESSNKIISEKFISVSMFMVRVVTYLNSSDLNIDPQSFMLVFSHLKEYEDDKIFIKYNEDTKIGEIIIKL